MKTTLTNSAPGLVAVTIAAAIAFAPAASADTNPLVPYGTDPIGPLSARLLRVQPRRGLHDERLPGRAVLIIRGSNSGPLYRPTLASCIVGKHV